jgi:hypothetical protein
MGAATAPSFPAFGQAAMRLVALYQECIAIGAWARLVFGKRSGNERIDFSCANYPRVRLQGSKLPANARRRERQKQRREAWVAKKKQLQQQRPNRQQLQP